MNLEFVDLKPQSRDGINYMLQRAIITPTVAPSFWSTWKSPAGENLRKLLTIRKETEGSSPVWAVYRLAPTTPDTEYGSFTCSYTLRNRSKLLPYQPKAVQYLCEALTRNGAALDGSDTGIGKTYVALAVCRELSLKPIIICKKSGITSWENGCSFMNINPHCIINWESAKTSRFPYVKRHKLPFSSGFAYRWSVPKSSILIFDEAHSANHDDTQNCALYLSSKGLPSLSLSATFADRPSRMRPFFYLVGAMSAEQYSNFLLSQGHFNNARNELESLSEVQDMRKINKMIFPRYGYRLSYDDPEVKRFFPGGVYQPLIINITKKDEKRQNDLYREMLVKVEKYRQLGKTMDQRVALLRYRQAAELFKADVLADLTRQYVSEGKSVAVFVNFRETLSYLAKSLKTRTLIFGDQDRYKISRKDVINAFQSNRSPVILCMADAGGISLDLHDVHGKRPRISLICPTYNPVTLKQILGRTRRAGSKSIPVMKLVYAAGTIESRVASRVNEKMANISALNDGDLMEPDLFRLGIKSEDNV